MVNGNKGEAGQAGAWWEQRAGWSPTCIPRVHPSGGGAAAQAWGALEALEVSREPQNRAPSPTSFPAWLLRHGHGLGTVGTELGQVCTQIRWVPLGAS